MRPEERLLLVCVRAAFDSALYGQVWDYVAQPLDWEYFQQIADQHGVSALVYQGIAAALGETTLPGWLPQLRAQAQAGAQRSLFLTAELLRLLRRFEAAGIAALPLKGAVLAAGAYQNLALRQFVDLDILIHRASLADAQRVLLDQGFQLEEQVEIEQMPAYLRTQHHFTFTHANGVIVELHHQLRERYFAFSIDLAGLWARADELAIGGQRVRQLAAEDVLLTLCVHGAGHCWERVIWVCDIAAVLQQAQHLAWEDALAHARALGAERMLLLGLLLAHDMLGAELPAIVQHRAQADRALAPLVEQVYSRLFRASDDARGLSETAWFYLRSRERYTDRARFVLRLLFTPTLGDWSLVRLPRRLSFAYYLLRPLRLLALLASRCLERDLDELIALERKPKR